jgi:hypothetical protein
MQAIHLPLTFEHEPAAWEKGWVQVGFLPPPVTIVFSHSCFVIFDQMLNDEILLYYSRLVYYTYNFACTPCLWWARNYYFVFNLTVVDAGGLDWRGRWDFYVVVGFHLLWTFLSYFWQNLRENRKTINVWIYVFIKKHGQIPKICVLINRS